MSLDKAYLALLAVYVLSSLLVGDRGGAIRVILTILILAGRYVRPIKLSELTAIIIAGSLIMTIIGLGRSSENVLSAGLDKFDSTSAYSATIELANSARVLYTAIEHVPEERDYFYGRLFVGSLLSAIPFAQSAYLELTDTPEYELSSSGYNTYLELGLYPRSGVGTSIITDIYLNYGLTGVLILMFSLGGVFRKANLELQLNRNHYWLVGVVMLAGFSFYLGRSGLFLILRDILWSLPIVYVLVKKKRFRNTPADPVPQQPTHKTSNRKIR